ncbi:MAG: DEAD/DEAH box helicase [Bacteroidota bacterium]|nr:DEAD/DEAH box helicase [Odoribacter sp.]MDP3641606.1 DEAD/DEAH box helicase [Bacteroidota bacterium]
MTFEETGLKPELLKAIAEMGFVTPTPIQEVTISHLITSTQDLVALAQTGTGKTAAFGLPVINNITMQTKEVQSLILCPTRELCLQITRDLDNFSKFIPGFKTISVYGGADITKQIRELKAGGQIVVGTPGRVHDLIRRKILNISAIRWLILDEADEMLTMGFKEELDAILSTTPAEKQTLLFSATMPLGISEIKSKYLNNALELSVGKRNAGAENVEHHYYVVHAKDKYATLKRIADNYPDCYAIVFCRTRMETREVAEQFMADGYNADALHGDLSQAQRDQVMARFRSKQLQMLIATDVAARGLDVTELSHVINYSMPDDPEIYIHRSGRTGRAGKNGISVTIVHMKETGRLKQIEKLSRKKFERKMVPGGEEIVEKQLFHLIDRVKNVEISDGHIEKYLPQILDRFDGMSSSDIVKHFVSLEFNELLDYYKNARDLNIRAEIPRDPFTRNDRGSERGGDRLKFTKLFINAGKKQNLNASGLIGMINEYSGRRNIEIGKIDIQRKFSFFEIDSNFERDLVKSLNNVVIEGHAISIGRVESTAGQEAHSESGSFRSEGRSGGGGYGGGFREGRREGGFNDRGDRPRRKRN